MSDSVSDSMSNMRDGLNDIVNYVMEMLKQRTEDQIKAIEDMKDAYNELIDAKKKSLDVSKAEESYGKKRAKQLKEIAKLQARIDMLSLDTSREAQAEKTKLLEQMAELQEGLSDTQSDYAIDNQKDALDKMKDAYEKEKDDEIKELEDSISSKQKLWEQAIDYIQSYWGESWDELKAELLQWNYDVGSDLEKNLVSAWDNATAAAQKYGDFVSAMQALENANGAGDSWNTGNSGSTGNSKDVNATIASKVNEMKQNSAEWTRVNASNNPDKKDKLGKLEDANQKLADQIGALLGAELRRGTNGVWYLPNGKELYKASTFVSDSGGTGNSNNAVATVGNRSQANRDILAWVGEMKRNSAAWNTLNASNDPDKTAKMKQKVARNQEIADQISDQYGKLLGGRLYLGTDGVWYLPNGKKLYETSMFVYHNGGIVGGTGTLREDEVLAKLKTGETVLTRKMWENAVAMVDRVTKMTEAMNGAGVRNDWLSGAILRDMDGIKPNTVTNITNDTRPVEITFGDTIINGADPDAVEKHREISREMMNEIARQIRRP